MRGRKAKVGGSSDSACGCCQFQGGGGGVWGLADLSGGVVGGDVVSVTHSGEGPGSPW